jgi:ATP-binding cassette, subfamily B, bacterial PglK
MKSVKELSAVQQKLSDILSVSQKRKFSIMLAISLCAALLEIAGISVLLHTVLSILKPEFVRSNFFTSFVYNGLGIRDSKTFILVISTFLFLFYVVKNVILVQLNKLQVRYAFEITDEVSSSFYRFIAKQDLLYFTQKKSSEIMHEIGMTSLSFAEGILLSSIVVISELMLIILALCGVLIYNPLLFVFSFLTLIPTAGILMYINRRKLRRAGARLSNISPLIYENAGELASGIANIKLWNGAGYFYDRYEKLKKEAYALKTNIYISSQFIPIRIFEVIAISGILCVVLYAMLADHNFSKIATYISIYAGVSFRLLPSINRVVMSSNNLSVSSYILDMLMKDVTTEEIIEASSAKLSLNREISLNSVSFSYPDGTHVLNDISIQIQKGSFVGLIGASGSGKSTAVNILSSLILPTSGCIMLDGKKLGPEDYAAYRFLFSYVEQEVFMLNDSVLRNVAFLDPNPDLDKAGECIEKVNLMTWLEALPNGWDTKVGELGSQISGGQKQRIAIARSLYKDAEVFIFDEVSNNLDTYSKEQTLMAIRELKKEGKTAILITHKEDELQFCDQVYTLKDGQLLHV